MMADLDIARRQTMYLLFFFSLGRENSRLETAEETKRSRETTSGVRRVSFNSGLSRQESENRPSPHRVRRPATNGTHG